MIAWSYSSIKTFDQCPKKYFHLKVVKDVKDDPGEAAVYGTRVHEAAELFIKEGKPIPDEFGYMRNIVEPLANKAGEKLTELRLGVKKTDTGYAACDFFDPQVWYRGIVDLLILNGKRAWMIDYKTGKSARYADLKQLDLMAAALFIRYPDLEVIKSGLAFVVSHEFPKKIHHRQHLDDYMNAFELPLARLEAAMENGIWNAQTSPLCGWCPVTTCEHWRPRRK